MSLSAQQDPVFCSSLRGVGLGQILVPRADQWQLFLTLDGNAHIQLGQRIWELDRQMLVVVPPQQSVLLLERSHALRLWQIVLAAADAWPWPKQLSQRRLRLGDASYLSQTCQRLQALPAGAQRDIAGQWLGQQCRVAYTAGGQAHVRELPSLVREAARILRYEDHTMSGAHLAHLLQVSASYLSSQFTAHMGRSIPQYKNWVRIEHVCTAMSQGADSLRSAAKRAGFGSYSQFHRAFSEQMGQSPRDYFTAQQSA